MDPNSQEQEIIKLLAKLKTASPEYPADKMAKRRAAFIASISAATIGGAVGTKMAASYLAKLFKGVSLMEKVIIGIEMTAVAGLTTYLGVTAYVHREDLLKLLLPPPTPALTTPIAAPEEPTSALLPAITVTATPTAIITSTIPPASGEEQPEVTSAPATQPAQPQPTEPPPVDTPGLHLGQTKTPKP